MSKEVLSVSFNWNKYKTKTNKQTNTVTVYKSGMALRDYRDMSVY